MGTGACTPIAGLQQRWMGVIISTYTSESLATEQHRRYVLNFRYLPKSISKSAQNTLLKISLGIYEKKDSSNSAQNWLLFIRFAQSWWQPRSNSHRCLALPISYLNFFPFCSLSASQPSPLSHQADAPSRRRPSPAGIAPGQPARDPRYMAHA